MMKMRELDEKEKQKIAKRIKEKKTKQCQELSSTDYLCPVQNYLHCFCG